MKKLWFITIIASLVLALTACSGTPTTQASATASTELSLEGDLLVGTFKLEDTSLAVTADQADSLLPLWETLESLASSNTAASQEVDAVVSQIKSTMSPEQIAKISAMKLTQQDLQATAIDTGTAASTTSSSGTSGTAKTSATQLQAGNMQGGGNPPSDMGGGMGGANEVQAISQAQGSITQAVASTSSASASQVSVAMLKALVALLQKKMA